MEATHIKAIDRASHEETLGDSVPSPIVWRALRNWSAQISGVRFLALLGMTFEKRMRNDCHSERKRGIYRVQRAHQSAPLDGCAKLSIVWERARVRVGQRALIFFCRTLTPTLSRIAGEGFQSAFANKCSAFV